MVGIESLETIFREQLCRNAARINFLVCFIIALLRVRTVNLAEIATAFPGRAKKDSEYKRLRRFFRSFGVDFSDTAKLLACLSPVRDMFRTLTIDRTNRKLGQPNINILLLGIAHTGAAIPLLWVSLEKQGNPNTEERIRLMDRFIGIFGAERIRCLTADREFIGVKWFGYLLRMAISFRIRIRENMLVTNTRGIPVQAKALFMNLRIGEVRILRGKRIVCGVRLFVVGVRMPDGEYLIIVTDKEPETAPEDYARRWEIETLFGCLKSRGFDFESTHMTEPERIDKLVALPAIAFCWCHLTGEWLSEDRPLRVKKHGRMAMSIFRYGPDHLREILMSISERRSKAKLKRAISLLYKHIRESQVSSGLSRNLKLKIEFLSCT